MKSVCPAFSKAPDANPQRSVVVEEEAVGLVMPEPSVRSMRELSLINLSQ